MMRRRNGNEEKSSPPPQSSVLDCDVGLGLKMQTSTEESYYSCKRATNNNSTTSTMGFPLYNSDQSNRFSGDGGAGFNQFSGGVVGGGMLVSEKSPFSGMQWQEFERQKIITKYIMASVPVPPELLLMPLPFSRTTTPTTPTPSLPPPTAVSQSNMVSGLELRFGSSGSDPEPWRCKRTDGKKWRCSRDVAPDQKYCERHAHKSRSRSRKPVEIPSSSSSLSSHNKYNSTSNSANTYSHPLIHHLPTSTTKTSVQFPTMASSATSYDQTRCIDWFMRGGSGSGSGTTNNIPLSASDQQQQQWQQQLFQTSSSTTNSDKNVSLYQPQQQYQDKGNFMSPNCYNLDDNSIIRHMLQNHQPGDDGTVSNPTKTQKTRHFIDAWEKEGKKYSESSLTLSMYAGNGIDDDDDENGNGNANGNLGIGMINSSVPWMSSCAPGGPLGEALCLGNASTTRPQGYGTNSNNDSNTNSSGGGGSKSCSGGEDGSHALSFIG